MTSIYQACKDGSLDDVRAFLDSDSSAIDRVDANGNTPMHSAAMYGQTNIISFLIERGADPNIKNSGGKTAKSIAELNGYLDLVRRFQQMDFPPIAEIKGNEMSDKSDIAGRTCESSLGNNTNQQKKSGMSSRNETRRVARAGICNVRYDEKIICEFAEKLYMRAVLVIIMHTLLGAFIGGIAGYTFPFFNRYGAQSMTLTTSATWGVILIGFIGFLIGVQKAFWLKLQAQLALCQVQIEINTRPE